MLPSPIRFTLCILATTLLAPSVAISQHPPALAASDSTERVVASIRATYDTGFNRLISALPASARDKQSDLWPLWEIGQFRAQQVAWVRMSGNQYVAITSGSLMPAWLVVVPPGSDALKRMGGTLQIDPTASILAAQIAPEEVTPTWAGIFLTHQLSLLADYVQGDPKDSSAARYWSAELQSDDIEFTAADFLGHGRLRAAIDSTFAQWAPRSSNDAVDRVAADTEPVLLLTLEGTVSAAPSRSRAEADLRGGVAMTAMVIRYCELHHLTAGQCASLLQRFEERQQAKGAAPN